MPFPERKKLIEFLNDPGSYNHNPSCVEHYQTHASDVFIAPPYVFKVKKPVDFGFLDFSTLEKRRFYCNREVELNRRLCEGIYIGVVEIRKNNGIYTFENEGGIEEYAVKMYKLQEKYFLKNLLKKGKASREDFVRVADKLEKFYRSQDVSDEVRNNARPENIKTVVFDNITGSSDYTGHTISSSAFDAIVSFNRSFFDNCEDLLNSRIQRGFIKDCHGDLHLEHINICPEDICIYDCIEFNDKFRHIDIASDTAFLAMDLDFKGYPGFSDFFVSQISERMNDRDIYDVLDFYKCFRASVRGKVESIKSLEEDVPAEERDLSVHRARQYFRLALGYALFGSRPALIVVFGTIGAGKSTVAGELAKQLGAVVYSSDVIRKELSGMDPQQRDKSGYGQGIYSEDVTEHTYNELLKRALDNTGLRGIAVLDATYSKRHRREQVRQQCEKLGINCFFIETRADEKVIRERVLKREMEGKSASDAGVDILESFRSSFDVPDHEEKANNYIEADTGSTTEEVVQGIFKRLAQNRSSLRS